MPIATLKLTNLGPLDKAEFLFDSQINVFVGPNNSGKTTALLALAHILIYPFTMPRKMLRDKSKVSMSVVHRSSKSTIYSGAFPIHLTTGSESGWSEKAFDGLNAKLEPLGYRRFIPAVRISTDFRSDGPGTRDKRERALRGLPGASSSELRAMGIRKEGEDEREIGPSWVRDDEIIQQLVDLDYQAYREGRPAIRKVIDDIAALVSEITQGFPITFGGIGQDTKGLFPQFMTPDGMVPLDFLSQGTQSLIQWCAQLITRGSQS